MDMNLSVQRLEEPQTGVILYQNGQAVGAIVVLVPNRFEVHTPSHRSNMPCQYMIGAHCDAKVVKGPNWKGDPIYRWMTKMLLRQTGLDSEGLATRLVAE